MTSYFKSYQGMVGKINTFAGGIVTINKGSIQDVVNLGNIRFLNDSDGTDLVSFDESDTAGGKVSTYLAGVVIGGIVGVVISGYSRVYDAINNGNLLAQSKYYARAGGIVGLAHF